VNDDIIYGRQPAHEVLQAGRREIREVLVRKTVKPTPETDAIVALARKRGAAVSVVDEGRLRQLAGGGHDQGVVVRAGPYVYTVFERLLESFQTKGREPALVLALDHVQDPQNLGSILRTADAAGVHGVILPKDRAVGVTSAVIRASAGAAEHVSVVQVVNLVRAMKELKDAGVWCAGLEAAPEAKTVYETDLTGPLAVVAGSEGEGLGRLVRETCDYLVKIPLWGRVTSLNVTHATAVALFEVRRQRLAGARR
jgi:23S rRNA (guanosine2251-2'-O)-methyltransferase